MLHAASIGSCCILLQIWRVCRRIEDQKLISILSFLVVTLRRFVAMSDEIKDFCQQLVRHALSKSQRSLITGSFVEIGKQHYIFQTIDLKFLMDLDIMYYLTDRYAFPLGQSVPEMYTGKVIRICSIGRHPGYTKLYNEEDNQEVTLSEMDSKFENRHGPANQINLINFEMRLSEKYLMLTAESVRNQLNTSYNIYER